ncbi:MAG: hypothetical protein RR202_04185 [Bacteroidales bacterium]
MKKHTVTLYALAMVAGAPFAAQGQESAKDSTLNRELLLEKEYNPIVRDADKINKLPEVEAPRANKTQIVYSDLSVQATPTAEANTLTAGDIRTTYDFSKKRGYLNLSGGNYLNLNGNLGYRFIDSQKAVFGIELEHQSASGTVDYIDFNGDTKQKINDNHANLYYRHFFKNFKLNTNLAFDYNRFNYYGYAAAVNASDQEAVSFDAEMQNRQRLTFVIGGESIREAEWMYKTNFGFNYFNDDYSLLKETTVDLGFGLSKQMGDNWKAGGDASLQMLFYGIKDPVESFRTRAEYESAGLMRFTPYVDFKSDNGIALKLGLNADFAYGTKPYFGISPDIRFDARVADGFFLYADWIGGMKQQSVSDITRTHRYFQPVSQHKNSYTLTDFTLGMRSNRVAGFWFDIYGGYAYTKNELGYYTQITTMQQTGGKNPSEGMAVANGVNSLASMVQDVNHWKLGVNLKYSYGKIFEGGLKVQKNGWSVKDKGEGVEAINAYRPGLEASLDLMLRPTEQLVFDLNYNLFAQRDYAVLLKETVLTGKADAVNQLNLKGTYLFNDTFALSAGVYNLLFQKYDLWYGMPNQGFSFQVGGSIRF